MVDFCVTVTPIPLWMKRIASEDTKTQLNVFCLDELISRRMLCF